MTDKTLNDYYSKRKSIYASLAKNCTSVPELLLKIEIYGIRWTQWDWALLFSDVIYNMRMRIIAPDDTNGNMFLYKDIIDAIDNTDMLDEVMTNKQVMTSITYVINGNARFMSRDLQFELCALLAHVFKKFPQLWNMSWMHTRFRDNQRKRWCKYHRLKNVVRVSAHKDVTDPYYRSKKYYEDFMKTYLLKERPNEED